MAKIISNVELTQTFSAWVDKTNEMAGSFANVVSVDALFPTGTAGVNGAFVSNTLTVTTGLLTANASANIVGSANVTVAVNVGANVSANTSALFVGNSSVNSIITSSSAKLGNTTVVGFVNVSSTANVGGAVNLRDNLTVNGALTVANAASLGNTTVTGFANVSGTANVGGAVNLRDNLTVNGAVTIANTLGSGNTSTANLSVTGFANVSGTANVGGATNLRSTLAVNGAVTISNTLSSGNTSTANLEVTGFANVSGTANVGGATTLRSTLVVNGAVTIANTLSSGNTTVANLTVSGVINRNPTITLAGDLTGSVTLTDLQNATLTATIAADSIALGTDTTGNYVATITNGAGLSGSGSGEGSTPTIAVIANNGIVANSTGVFVNSNTGLVANSSGLFVNSSYIATISANNASYLGGELPAYYTNATNISTGTLAVARGGTGVGTSTGTGSVVLSASPTFTGNAAFANIELTGIITANGSIGTESQVLRTDGSGKVYWAAPLLATDGGYVADVNAGNGLVESGNSTVIALAVVANSGVTANSTGVFVNAQSGLLANSSGLYVNASSVAVGTLPVARGGTGATDATTARSNLGAGTGDGTVTSVASGSGLSGGPITGSGTLSVLANNGIIANSSGVFVNANTAGGLVSNTSGVFVNTTYVATLSANNAAYLGGELPAYYTNATNISTGTLAVARGGTGVTTANGTGSVIRQSDAVFLANTTIDKLVANSSLGTAGQILTSNGSGSIYWSNPSAADITAVAAGNGLTGGGTSGDVTVSVLANSGIVANSSGLFVNASAIAHGTLPVDRGGTGTTTFTSGALLKGNGTSAVSNASAADIVAAIGTTRVANATYADSAGSATNATRATNSNNSLVVDDTTTSGTFYPVWVGAASGDQAIKVSSTKLSFNPSTGVVTATGFSGNGASLTSLDAGNIGSGTLAIARGGTGTTSSTGTGSVVLSASPTLTGTPAAPTAAADTNTTQLATTAYVIGQGYLKSATASSTYLPLAGGTVSGNLIVSGNLTVDGTTTTINSTTISVDDKNIELGNTASPSDASADGGGITLKGTSDKTFNWVDATDAWTSSEHLNLLTGKAYYINGTSVLSSTTLGSGVTGSSLTSVGTIGTGVWQGTAVGLLYGGTGATSASGARTNLGATTVGGNLFTLTNPSAITFPRFNADNTVSALSATDFRTAIGAGTSSTTGTVTSVASGNGITGGTITSTGTLSVVANSGIVANTTGVFVNANSGIVANSTGVFVNANSGIVANTTGVFVRANNGIVANSTGVFVSAQAGLLANSSGLYVNASSVSVGTLPVARGGTGVTTSTGTGSVVLSASPTFSGNVLGIEESLTVALSDETTTITTGTAKLTFRAPFAWTLTKIPRASLSTVSSSGTPTVDINVNGSTILSTKLTIDANEKTSTTAATAAVLSSTSIADDDEITMDIDTAGTGAKGLKVTIYYKRAS